MGKLSQLNSKIIAQPELQRVINRWRLKSERIVFTNGCFDLLHQGHIDYLSKAADLGTKLIIGLNTDDSVKRLNKGKNRPIQEESSRAIILAALKATDLIVYFDEDTPAELIKEIKPDVLVKGSDYEIDQIAGHEVVLKNGGEVLTVDFLPGHSTSQLIQRAKND